MDINFCFWICLFSILLEAIKNSCLGVPGGCWKRERQGRWWRQQQLEDEEGACAALSFLHVVSTVLKPYHQVCHSSTSSECEGSFTSWWNSGGFRKGRSANTFSASDDEAEEMQWSDDENIAMLIAPEFPKFTTKVQEAIISLGQGVGVEAVYFLNLTGMPQGMQTG